jgi:putative hemolysin
MSLSSFATNFLLILLLIVVNGVFVMSELAILSARKLRMQQAANQGNRGAKAAIELSNEPNNFLATVQIGITLITIVSGAYGEKQFSEFIKPILEKNFASLNPESIQGLSFGLSILIITSMTLVIGELVPKRLALNSPEAIAVATARPMQLLAKVATPLAVLLSRATNVVLQLMGVRPSTEPQVTEEEIKVLIEQGTEAGMFEQAEEDIMKRVFQLGDRRVSSIMTPRLEMIWLDVEDSSEEQQRTLQEDSHARFPVCQGGLDTLLGVVKVYDLLMESINGESLDFMKSLQKPVYVPESTRALKILELFQQSGNQMAFVVDEYGVIQGLVTLTDILQALVGDLPSVEDMEEPQAVQREDGSWLFDGMLPIYQFKEILDMEERTLPGEDRGNYQTLGGFVVMHLSRIPETADHFTWGGYRFEVVDMDGNRVDKVLVMIDPKI